MQRATVIELIKRSGRYDVTLEHRSDAWLIGFAEQFERSDGNPDQPRAANGQFGEGGGAAKMPDAHALLARAVANGGFTYDPRTGAFPTTGYAVSIYPGNEAVFKGALQEADIASYMEKHDAFFKENPGSHVGAWYDGEADKWYLDVSHVATSPAEAERLAKENNQEAYYDLAKHETVIVKSAAERRIDAAKDTAMTDKPKTPPPGAPRLVIKPGTPAKDIAAAMNAIRDEYIKARDAAKK